MFPKYISSDRACWYFIIVVVYLLRFTHLTDSTLDELSEFMLGVLAVGHLCRYRLLEPSLIFI